MIPFQVKFFIYFSLPILGFVGCGDIKKPDSALEKNVKEIAVKEFEVKPGSISDTLILPAGGQESYLAYIPKAYSAGKLWPVCYIFDPHGRGRLPLSLYSELADEYGYILIASNYSRNGRQWGFIERHVEALRADVEQRFSVDVKQRIMLGFSGGAKVAMKSAYQRGGVNTVIACGAGFPANTIQNGVNFNYLTLVGSTDFNLVELYNVEKDMIKQGIDNEMIVFNGKHDWPDMQSMNTAFLWNEIKAGNMVSLEEKINKLSNSNIGCDHRLVIADALDRIQGLEIDQKNCREKYFSSSKLEKLILLENQRRKNYQTSMSEKDIAWWNSTIDRLAQMAEGEQTITSASAGRDLAYIGLLSFLYTDQMLNQHRLPEAQRFLNIFKKVDGSNPDRYYLEARWFASQNRNDEALRALQWAVDNGYNDPAKFKSEADFLALKKDSRFHELVRKIYHN